MSVSGVNGIGVAAYAYTNSSKKTVEESNFASEVQKAGESQNTTATASAWAGDMVIPYPPNYSGFTYDSSISNKSKEEIRIKVSASCCSAFNFLHASIALSKAFPIITPMS